MANIKISLQDLPEQKNWKDGMEYSIHVLQVSPGVFKIASSHPVMPKKVKQVVMPPPLPKGAKAPRYAK